MLWCDFGFFTFFPLISNFCAKFGWKSEILLFTGCTIQHCHMLDHWMLWRRIIPFLIPFCVPALSPLPDSVLCSVIPPFPDSMEDGATRSVTQGATRSATRSATRGATRSVTRGGMWKWVGMCACAKITRLRKNARFTLLF